jgi:predicted lipoprotein with Yx(FWY)xxD motif
MPTPARVRGRRSGLRRRPGSRLIVLGVAVVAVGSMAGIAVAASPTLRAGTVTVNGKSKTVLVDSRGVTLYTLSGESVADLKCVSSTCFGLWPPYEVSATATLRKARGVRGTPSELHRIQGNFYQVLLNSRPLYRFAPDHGRKGSALGEGITSFGGTWHVVAASLGSAPGPIDERFRSAHRLVAKGIVGVRTLWAPPALPVTPVLWVLAALGVATMSFGYARTRARMRRAPATARLSPAPGAERLPAVTPSASVFTPPPASTGSGSDDRQGDASAPNGAPGPRGVR